MQPPVLPATAPTVTKASNSNEEIAAVSKDILEAANEPILLSNLGSRLSKHYGRALREVLASRKLKHILETELMGQLEFSGDLSQVKVRLLSDADKLNAGTYHPIIWAAFFKPVKDGCIGRAIKSSRRFDFNDVASETEVPSGWHYIRADLIPDGELPKEEREAEAKMVIHDWCVQENVDRDSLLISQSRRRAESAELEPSPVAPLSEAPPPSAGTASLRAMIEAVPEDKRKFYSLPLDLIYQLIR